MRNFIEVCEEYKWGISQKRPFNFEILREVKDLY